MLYRICFIGLLIVGLVLALWSILSFETDNFLLVLFCVGAVLFFGMAILGAFSRR